MKPLKLTHTRKALEEFDIFHKKWSALWDNHLSQINNRRALFLLRLHDEAEMNVRIAFYEDTKDRNNLDNCKRVGLSWLREMVAKEVIKIRPGYYKIGTFWIENEPNPEYSKSKPWRITDHNEVLPNPIGRTKTLKEAIDCVRRMIPCAN